MNNFFTKELFFRILSLLIFIPLVVIPLILSKYASVAIYLLFISIILLEINNMKIKANKTFVFNSYTLLTVTSFFLFLHLLISNTLLPTSLLMIIFTIWLFDTFSYLGGKIIGGPKLMPKISAGKTFSGLITGIVITLIIVEVILQSINIPYQFPFYITLLIVILSFMGDTIVSILKRYVSIKDSGNIMPGHGGLLDRFDSFIFVFFIFGLIKII